MCPAAPANVSGSEPSLSFCGFPRGTALACGVCRNELKARVDYCVKTRILTGTIRGVEFRWDPPKRNMRTNKKERCPFSSTTTRERPHQPKSQQCKHELDALSPSLLQGRIPQEHGHCDVGKDGHALQGLFNQKAELREKEFVPKGRTGRWMGIVLAIIVDVARPRSSSVTCWARVSPTPPVASTLAHALALGPFAAKE